MGWKIKTMLDSIAMIAIAIGTGLAAMPQLFIFGTVLIAVGVGVKAASEYLAAQGVIEYKKSR